MTIPPETIPPETIPPETIPPEIRPTELAETYLGNVSEKADLAIRIAQAKEETRCLDVSIGLGDRTKGRILTHTATGQAVGIVKTRDWLLRDGDVFLSKNNYLVIISIQQQQVMTLQFEAGVGNRAIALVHLGHVLGNQHWPIVVKGDVLYVALVTEAAVMESTLRKMVKALAIEGLQIGYETKSADESVDFSGGVDVHHHHS
ncbi:MAG: hypothetical protein WA984_09460 [Phormidesmis sp.]